MTPDENRSLAKAMKMISRFVQKHPLEDEDVDEDGELTIEAIERLMSTFERVLPQKAFHALQKHTLELRMTAVLAELVAIGALEQGTKDGQPAYRKVRDWTYEEHVLAWKRAEKRIHNEGAVKLQIRSAVASQL